MSTIISILRDNLIALILGSAFSLLTLITDNWLNSVIKFELAILLIVLFILIIIIKKFYEDLKLYLTARKEVQEYYGFMPTILRFLHFQRIYNIDSNGDLKATWVMKVANESDRTISNICIPMYWDLDSGVGSPVLEVERVQIGLQDVTLPVRCYKTDGILSGESSKQEKGGLWIPFSDVGGLKGKSEKHLNVLDVKIDFTVRKCLKKIYSDEGEYISMDVYHPTELTGLTIFPPNDSQIFINPTRQYPDGIEVHDSIARIVDTKELSEVDKPRTQKGREITWEIKKPKLNYQYTIKFRCKSSSLSKKES